MSTRRIRSRGQAATDYLLVLVLVAAALVAGSDGPLMQLVDAIAARYERFTWSISLP